MITRPRKNWTPPPDAVYREGRQKAYLTTAINNLKQLDTKHENVAKAITLLEEYKKKRNNLET